MRGLSHAFQSMARFLLLDDRRGKKKILIKCESKGASEQFTNQIFDNEMKIEGHGCLVFTRNGSMPIHQRIVLYLRPRNHGVDYRAINPSVFFFFFSKWISQICRNQKQIVQCLEFKSSIATLKTRKKDWGRGWWHGQALLTFRSMEYQLAQTFTLISRMHRSCSRS